MSRPISEEESQGFMMFLRSMLGEENVIENMEKEARDKAIARIQLARNLNPNKEVWESLGFEFYDIEGDDVLYDAKLPEGWTLEATEHQMWTNILDEQGRLRGKMFYKASFYDRRADMYLKQRYDICKNYIGDTRIEIYFGNDEEVLYAAGLVIRSDNYNWEATQEQFLRKEAIRWAEQNYPNYKDITAYWDLPTKKSDKTKSKHQ